MGLTQLITIGLTGFVGVVVGALLKGYLGKKGENIAIQEDIEKILIQLRATTQTTEEIKSAISDRSWDRQRHWEMKRDALFEAIQALGRANDALQSYVALSGPDSQSVREQHKDQFLVEQHTLMKAWTAALDDYASKTHLASLICGKAVAKALVDAGQEVRRVGLVVLNDQPFTLTGVMAPVHRAIKEAQVLARRELGLEDIT